MKAPRSFASDNNASVHPLVMKAIQEANQDHAVAYGDDDWTRRAVEAFRKVFGPEAQVFFVFNGTAANVLSLRSLTRPFHAIICSRAAHIQNDECGAPEMQTGCKLIPVEEDLAGKISVDSVRRALQGVGNPHHVQPKVLSISQSTEYGGVYTLEEVRALSALCHENKMYLHVDGARIANAAASLNVGLRELTRDCGVDVLSFGGTKNGLLLGEAVVFFDPKLASEFEFLRKQGMQLASKMRFVSAQFEVLFRDELWLNNARHANRMARSLADQLKNISTLQIARPVQANAVFARVKYELIPLILKRFFFHIVLLDAGDGMSEVRWMASFDTTEEDVRAFTDYIKEVSNQGNVPS